jgi:hypothetical protein
MPAIKYQIHSRCQRCTKLVVVESATNETYGALPVSQVLTAYANRMLYDEDLGLYLCPECYMELEDIKTDQALRLELWKDGAYIETPHLKEKE